MPFNITEEMKDYSESNIIAFKTAHDVIVFAMCGLGIPANMVSFSVLSRKQIKSPISCCLQFLAFFDTLVLCFYTVLTIVINVQPWVLFFQYAALQASVWTTLLVSLERFIAVCYPLKARTLCTYRRTVIFNIITVILSVSMNIPRIFLTENNKANENISYFLFLNTRFELQRNMLKKIGLYLTDWEMCIAKCYSWIEFTAVYFMPMLAIAYFNISIYKAVKKAEKSRQRMSQSQQKEINIAKTVLGVVVVFFITGFPWLVIKLVIHYGLVSLLQYVKLLWMFNPLIVSNSAANFVIYFGLNRDFRTALLATLKNFRETMLAFLKDFRNGRNDMPDIYIIEATKL